MSNVKNVSKKISYSSGDVEVVDGIQYTAQDNGRESSLTMYPDEIIIKAAKDYSISVREVKKM